MPLHGDLVNGLTCALFLPFYVYKAYSGDDSAAHHDDNHNANQSLVGPSVVCACFAAIAASGYRAWRHDDNVASWISFFATIGSIHGIGLYQWPHDDEPLLRVQLIWQLLICTANTTHSLSTKLLMGLDAACSALLLAYISPLYTLHEQYGTIFCIVGAYMALNYGILSSLHRGYGRSGDSLVDTSSSSTLCQPSPTRWNELEVHQEPRKFEYTTAMILLIATFLALISYEIYTMMSTTGYAVIGGYNIIRAGVFASVGLVASNVFRQDSHGPTRLLQNGHVTRRLQNGNSASSENLARFALDSSDTPMALTNHERIIVWCNDAFCQATMGSSDSNLVNTLLDVALMLRPEDASSSLQECFCVSSPRSLEAVVHGKRRKISVSPMSESDNSLSLFVIVLQGVLHGKDR